MPEKKYKLTVMFDLDETLFVARKFEIAELELLTHLTKSDKRPFDYVFYMIYRDEYAKIFSTLLQLEDVRVGFITAGEYDGKVILPFLEHEYGLPENSLTSGLYINAFDFGDKHTLKGIKLNTLRLQNVFAPDEAIILLDDNIVHIQNAREHYITGVLASGFLLCWRENGTELEECYIVESSYFQELHTAIQTILEIKNRQDAAVKQLPSNVL